jgi:hypothetical protein
MAGGVKPAPAYFKEGDMMTLIRWRGNLLVLGKNVAVRILLEKSGRKTTQPTSAS